MIQIGYAKKIINKEAHIPETRLYLFTEEDKARLQDIVKTLNSCGITLVWISTAAFFEGTWAITFPHHGNPAKDPLEELKRSVGPFRES